MDHPVEIEKSRVIIEICGSIIHRFTFIFDSGSGSFLFAAESENIINLVKSKLGL